MFPSHFVRFCIQRSSKQTDGRAQQCNVCFLQTDAQRAFCARYAPCDPVRKLPTASVVNWCLIFTTKTAMIYVVLELTLSLECSPSTKSHERHLSSPLISSSQRSPPSLPLDFPPSRSPFSLRRLQVSSNDLTPAPVSPRQRLCDLEQRVSDLETQVLKVNSGMEVEKNINNTLESIGD